MGKSKFEVSVELVKALTWPAIVSALLISFWKPLHETVNLLPTIIDRSDTITIAGLSLKLGQELRSEAPQEVRASLKALSLAGIELLLNREPNTRTSYPKELDSAMVAEWHELITLELAYRRPAGDDAFEIGLTQTGKTTRAFLISVIIEFIKGMKESKMHYKEEDK